ncbi:MAG: glycine cleavage system protein H [Candidatus Marinimicrobia bacterium]|nr:glycine cleavage system protein H [Candidatus Neomarinimicrobiota bacterium]
MMIPEDLKYTKEHEWIKIEGKIATIGITEYAQSELGDIVFVEMPSKGSQFSKDDTIGTIEAVKTVADIYSPINGIISEVNQDIESNPELINSDPYSGGWIIKMSIGSIDQNSLLDHNQYSEFIS